MFRVSAVLRRYDADVPPTAVGACCGHVLGSYMRVLHADFCDGRTQWVCGSLGVIRPVGGMSAS